MAHEGRGSLREEGFIDLVWVVRASSEESIAIDTSSGFDDDHTLFDRRREDCGIMPPALSASIMVPSMKKHQDLLAVLRANKMRVTPLRRLLIQFFLDHKAEQPSLKEVQDFLSERIAYVDRSSTYRNLEVLKKLDIIQELDLPSVGKRFQYVFDRQVHHFYICKACGKLKNGNKDLFEKIEAVLKDVHGFEKANLSVVFYGYCSKCSKSATS